MICLLIFVVFRGSEKLLDKNKRKAEKLIEEVQIIKVSNNVAQILRCLEEKFI